MMEEFYPTAGLRDYPEFYTELMHIDRLFEKKKVSMELLLAEIMAGHLVVLGA